MLNPFRGRHFRMKKIINFLFLGVCGVLSAELREIKKQVGDTVTLDIIPPGSNTPEGDDQILWSFGSNGTKLADYNHPSSINMPSEQFRGRLQLNNQTGSLTITQLSVTDSGKYEGQLVSGNGFVQPYNLTVYAPVSPPQVDCTSSDNQSCSLECSVENGREVTLSWYRGEERLNQTSSLHSSRLTLPLVVTTENRNNSYSCVSENPVSNQTSRGNVEQLCPNNTGSGQRHILVVAGILALLVGVVVLAVILTKRKKRKAAATHSASVNNNSTSPHHNNGIPGEENPITSASGVCLPPTGAPQSLLSGAEEEGQNGHIHMELGRVTYERGNGVL